MAAVLDLAIVGVTKVPHGANAWWCGYGVGIWVGTCGRGGASLGLGHHAGRLCRSVRLLRRARLLRPAGLLGATVPSLGAATSGRSVLDSGPSVLTTCRWRLTSG